MGLRPAIWFAAFCGLSAAVKGPEGGQQQQQVQQQQEKKAAAAARGRPTAAEAGALLASRAAQDFWTFCACQLAYPGSVVALFPEARDKEPLVRGAPVMEALKAAFRYLGDPGGQTQFVAERLAGAVAPAPPAGSGTASSRPATSHSSSPAAAAAAGSGAAPGARSGAGAPCYSAWALLDLLLDEWLKRAWANAQHMERLKSAVAAMQPPLRQQVEEATAGATSSGRAAVASKLCEAYAAVASHLAEPAGPQQLACAASPCSQGMGAAAQDACAGSGAEAAGDALEALVAAATHNDGAAAWQAFQLLLSLLQVARANRHTAGGGAQQQCEQAEEPKGAAAQPHGDAATDLRQALQQVSCSAGVLQQLTGEGGAAGDGSCELAAAAKVAQDLATPGAMAAALAVARARQQQQKH